MTTNKKDFSNNMNNAIIPDGQHVSYYPFSTQPKEIYTCQNGKMHGAYAKYDSFGNPVFTATYEHDMLNGVATTYYPFSKKPYESRTYKHGQMHGIRVIYDTHGNIINKHFYVNNTEIEIDDNSLNQLIQHKSPTR